MSSVAFDISRAADLPITIDFQRDRLLRRNYFADEPGGPYVLMRRDLDAALSLADFDINDLFLISVALEVSWFWDTKYNLHAYPFKLDFRYIAFGTGLPLSRLTYCFRRLVARRVFSQEQDDQILFNRSYFNWLNRGCSALLFDAKQIAVIRSVREGLRLSKPGKSPIPQSLRTQVFERDAYRCRSCGDWHDLACDHVIPEALGGPTVLENLQTLCRACNAKKGAKLPAELLPEVVTYGQA